MRKLFFSLFALVLAILPAGAQTYPGEFPANSFSCNPTGSGAPTKPCTAAQANTVLNAVDNLFKSGRPWVDVRAFGALGDQTTDDTTAFQNAANALSGIGGIVYIPPGNYCVKTGPVTVNSAITVEFVSTGRSRLVQTCGANVKVFSLNGGAHALRGFSIQGSQTVPQSAQVEAVALGSGCVECLVDHMWITGGS